MFDDDKIYTNIRLQPKLVVVTTPAACSTRANDKDRTPCLGKAVLMFEWYVRDQEECSCCPYYDNGYVPAHIWACPDCVPALLRKVPHMFDDYRTTVVDELDALERELLAPITAVPDSSDISEWKQKQAERESEAQLTNDQKLRRALHIPDETDD